MTTTLQVLMVEDSADDAELIIRELRRGDYALNFERVDTEEAMRSAIKTRKWDVVICDYSLPQFSGAHALRLLREVDQETPFIYVSGTIGEDMAVAALKQGAQDYVLKGHWKRLLPAVQRELKEAERQRERAQLERQVRQLERFEAIGRLAGGIAHDFNNVIGAILGWAQLGQEETPKGSPWEDRFDKIRKQAERAAALTAQLLAFARRQVLQAVNLNLNDSISELAAFLKSGMGEDIEFKSILGRDLDVIRGDASQVGQVIMNLCINARDAMPKGGRLIVETQNVELDEEFCRRNAYGRRGRFVMVSVSDTGVGMDAATLDRIFEPFFTTKEQGKGTGLGLATVYGIVKQHDGFVNVYSEVGQGTTFRVYFPAGDGSVSQQGTEVASISLAGKETILVAEDHEGIRELAQEVLSSLGYKTILAADGTEALHKFMHNLQKIDLVLVDVVMPGLGGLEVYERMRTIRPDLPVVFTTGHTAESACLNPFIEAGAAFLQKPYAPHTLGQVVRTALDRSRRSRPKTTTREDQLGDFNSLTGT
jgi:two-component system, cell cycle sensor histidine kinase and response regulator CckA